jgi:hypothetical protein
MIIEESSFALDTNDCERPIVLNHYGHIPHICVTRAFKFAETCFILER